MGRDVESQIKEIEDHYRKYDEEWRMKPGERKKALEYLLCGYSATDICDAITGMFLSDFHQGRNKDGAVWTSFHYVFREHNFDKFRGLAHQASDNARLRAKKEGEKIEADRLRSEARKSMVERHLNGFRYANHAPDSREDESPGGMVE